MGPLRDLLHFTRPYPWAIPVLAVLGVLASLAEGLGIGLIIPLLDGVLGAEGDADRSGPLAALLRSIAGLVDTEHSVTVLVLAIVGLVALKTLIVLADLTISTGVIARAMRDLRVALSRQLLALSYEYFARIPQGRLINLLDAQTYRASEALRALTVLIGSASTVLVFGVLLLLLSWQLTIVVALVGAPVSLAVRLLSKTAHRRGEELVDAYSDMADRILELLIAMRTIRIFNREALEAERFAAAARNVERSYRHTEILAGGLPAIVELLYVPVFIAVLAAAWYLDTGIPTILVFMLFLYRLQNPLKRLDANRVILATYASAVRDLRTLLDESDKPYLTSGTRRFERLVDSIEFDGVEFRYEGSDAAALAGVSLTLRAGTTTMLVGDSGSGKSTLINLLCRFYDPQAGAIRIDGVDLREFELTSWRARVAFAGQDADLMSGSVRFNIAFGVDNPTDAAIEAAARAAQAHDFICELPQGYATDVGPRGTQLSGGQRQRIALARALLCRPDLLILDEATNAVDSITEAGIQQALTAFAPDMTVLVVAHRLNTLHQADQVLVMRGGVIVQRGTPSSLLSADGALAALVEAQRASES
jgi:ATP-binding cassette, subfamily B, bacterial MsbA